MSRKLTSPRVGVHVKLDQELHDYFKALLLSPTEGRFKQGFSALVERLLQEERARHIQSAREASRDQANGALVNSSPPEG